MKYIAEYKCGCSDGPKAKRDMLEYCGKHGHDLRRWIPDLSPKKITELKKGKSQ